MSRLQHNYNANLYPGEISWEVMEQSDVEGEVPVRLVLSGSSIRTLTSQILTIPSEIKELWKVNSIDIVKVSWCPHLCVLSVLYHQKGVEQEKVKVFLASHYTGHKILKTYKRMKPISVHLSPSRPFLTNRHEKTVSTSFKLPEGLPNEKFWRVYYPDDFSPQETFIGINAAGLRLLDPLTHEVTLVIDSINLVLFRHFHMFEGNILKIKYVEYNSKNKLKKKRIIFEIHPAVGKDIMAHLDYCSTFGDDYKQISDIPKINVPLISSTDLDGPVPLHDDLSKSLGNDKSKALVVPQKIARSHSDGTLKKMQHNSKKEKKEKKERKGEKDQKGEKSKDKQTNHTLSNVCICQEIPIEEVEEKSTGLSASASANPKSKNKLLLDVFSENKENISPDLSLIFPTKNFDLTSSTKENSYELAIVTTKNNNFNNYCYNDSNNNFNNNNTNNKENIENTNPELAICSTKIAIKKNNELLLQFKEPELKLDAVQKPSRRPKGMMKI